MSSQSDSNLTGSQQLAKHNARAVRWLCYTLLLCVVLWAAMVLAIHHLVHWEIEQVREQAAQAAQCSRLDIEAAQTDSADREGYKL